jgi:hypothetical protein
MCSDRAGEFAIRPVDDDGTWSHPVPHVAGRDEKEVDHEGQRNADGAGIGNVGQNPRLDVGSSARFLGCRTVARSAARIARRAACVCSLAGAAPGRPAGPADRAATTARRSALACRTCIGLRVPFAPGRDVDVAGNDRNYSERKMTEAH